MVVDWPPPAQTDLLIGYCYNFKQNVMLVAVLDILKLKFRLNLGLAQEDNAPLTLPS
jgi:hypothetical protein